VLSLPRCSYVVTRSRPYPLKVLAVSGWRLGTQAERFASIHSVLDSALNAVIDSVIHSDANKHLPAVEPPAEGPQNTEDEEA
jgi:hypothetical protein